MLATETAKASTVEEPNVETGEVSTADTRELSVEAVSVEAIEITVCRPPEAEVSILSIINSLDQPLSNKSEI